MKGVNTIIMNKATVMEAIQEYLEKRTTNPDFDITNFEESSERADLFHVEVTEKLEE